MDKYLSDELLKEFNNYRIHELRDIARNYGVKSPTSLTKSQIIAELTEISQGKKEPYVNGSKVGRPPLHLEDRSMQYKIDPHAYYDPIVIKDLLAEKGQNSMIYTFSSPNAYENTNAEQEILEGYFSLDFEAYGVVYKNVLSTNCDIKIPLYVVHSYGLRSGDFVKCVGKSFGERGIVISKVLEINGVKTPISNRPRFEEMEHKKVSEVLMCAPIFDLPFEIKEGGSYFVEYDNRKFLPEKAYEFAKSIAKTKKVVFININSDKNNEFLSDENLFVYNLPIDMEQKYIAHATNIILVNCKRRVELGENLVVIMANIGELIKILDMAKKEFIDDKIGAQTLLWFNKVINSAKNTIYGKLTLIAVESLFLPQHIKDIVVFDIVPKFSDYFLK